MTGNNSTMMPGPKTGKRQWRVGTLSMGTILIVFGLVLLLAQFKSFSAVELVSTWWPAVMIILGLEIIAAHYFSGEDKPPIKYDLLSILMVLLIGGITFGLYALSSVGILPALTESVTSQRHTIDVPEQRFGLQDNIKNIVVKGSEFHSGFNRLYLQQADSNEVVAFAQATVSAKSQEAAAALVPEGLVNTHVVGDTLFLDFRSVPTGSGFQDDPYVNHTVILPCSRNVHIEAESGALLKLKLNDLKADWVIDSPGIVEVTVAKNADVKVEAFAMRLGGKAAWGPVNSGTGAETKLSMVKTPEGPIVFEKEIEGGTIEAKGQAEVTFGKGTHRLQIDADEVIINDI